MIDPQVFVNDLYNWRKAIGRATCCGNNAVAVRFVDVVIHPVYDIGGVTVLDRRRYNHLLYACVKVGGELCLCFEDTSAVDHHIDTLQRQRGDVAGTNERQTLAVNCHATLIMGEIGLPAAVDRVELKQMGMHLGITHRVIDPCNFCPPFQQRLQGQLADAA